MTTIPGWPDFQKSSRSDDATNCVAVDRTRTTVRDTKNMGGGMLQVSTMRAAFDAIKAGRFDLT